jgi:transposase
MEKFTLYKKITIGIESFTRNYIAELCRRHGVLLSTFYKWRVEKFYESERNRE